MGEITDLYEEFVQLAGMPRESEWLAPPVTEAEVAFTEEALGIDLPADRWRERAS